MSRYSFISPNTPSGLLRLADLEMVVTHLRGEGVAVLPTETGYMIAAVATSRPAVTSVFAAKRRDATAAMHVACASIEMASRYAHLDPAATLLLGALTPGPLSVVVRQKETLPDELVTLGGTVGIRIPDSAATLQVIAALDLPVTATSLNRSGEQAGPLDRPSLDALEWGVQDRIIVVDDPGAVRYASPSTLVRLCGSTAEILRSGPVSLGDLVHAAGGGLSAAGS